MEALVTTFLLVFMRIFGFFVIAPAFGRREFPFQARVGLALFVTAIIFPVIDKLAYPNSVLETFAFFLKEAAVGFTMGFVVFAIFSAVFIMGEIVDFQMGFGIVSVLDPQTSTQVPILGNFFYLFVILIFFTIDGHHVLLNALIKSFELLPPGEPVITGNLLFCILDSFYAMFEAGVKMSFPLISATFLADFALGIMARTVPQMNVFIIGLPFKIVTGVFFLIILLPAFVATLDLLFNGSYEMLELVLQGMAGRP